MKQSATDPTTGEIDMDIITTGMSSSSTERIKSIAQIIKKINVDYKVKVTKAGVQYLNLFDFVN
jgi:DNA replicative helicase MCM subunit Mcm2 (Cdc46/Mcm family)